MVKLAEGIIISSQERHLKSKDIEGLSSVLHVCFTLFSKSCCVDHVLTECLPEFHAADLVVITLFACTSDCDTK